MNKTLLPAITRLVMAHNGPVAFAQVVGNGLRYQAVQVWVKRGWASPMHMQQIETHLKDGITVADLYRDRQVAQAKKRKAAGAKSQPSQARTARPQPSPVRG